MNILHISPYFPDLNANHAGGVCMGKQIETLRKKHKVYVQTFIASDFDYYIAEKYVNNKLYDYVKINKYTRLFHVLVEPIIPNYYAVRSSLRFTLKLIRNIKKWRIDAVHAEYASMGQYFWLIKFLFPSIKILLVEHDVTIQSYERKREQSRGIFKWYYMWQCKLIICKEKKYCKIADYLVTFNDKDKTLILKYYDRADVRVINPYYGIEHNEVMNLKKRDFQFARICFLGQMGRAENYEAAMRLIRISKKVINKVPELQVYIIGNNPPSELKQEQNDYVHITGFVDNVDPYIIKSQLAVFPLTLGAGIKLKVLRSMALGVPVITGKIGAEGIDEEGKAITLAENDKQYEEAIINLIHDNNKYQRLTYESEKMVYDKFDWSLSEHTLFEIYQS